MKKKVLSALLSAAMISTLMAGCGGDSQESSQPEETGASTQASVEATAAPDGDVTTEAIPAAKYYFSFDEKDGTKGIQPTGMDAGALYAADKDVKFIPGVKGEALYTDGLTGYKLTDVNGVGDTYSVSFWMYATRFANYMPTVQFGPDVHGDATGGQHYLNITRTEWNPDGASFPCVWSYDQLDDALWPAWAPEEANEHLKEWMNIVLVVDPTKVSEDGATILADLYVNGELFGTGISVVNGTMAASDNYDFLIGVNYWDAVFKGAFDELYIFDQALTPGQVKSLYADGDANAAYVEPERVIEVVASGNAIDTLGNTDLQAGFWTDWTRSFEIKDGETKEVVLHNYSDGVNNWDNYVMVFTNEATEAHVDPNSTGNADHKEWAVLRADCYGWMGGDNPETAADKFDFTWSWGNWDTWRTKVMVDTTVNMTVNRNGDTLTIIADNVDYNGTSNTSTSVLKTGLTAEDPCYFLFTNEGSYVELLKVDDAIVVEKDPAAVASIGKTDYSNGWWTDWSEAHELKDGETTTIEFKNYSDGVNNWDNYVFMFTNEYSAAGTDPNTASANHVEYAAVRADAYGWDDEYTQSYETSWGDDWATWINAMKDADVTMKLTRKGGDIVMDATIVDRNGNTLTNKTTLKANTLTGADPVYWLITCEECYIDIMSIQ